MLRPSEVGYVVPGCHAFRLRSKGPQLRVFVRTPKAVIAERALLSKVADRDVERVLDAHLSPNWRDIEHYEHEAEVVVSGLEGHESQIELIRQQGVASG